MNKIKKNKKNIVENLFFCIIGFLILSFNKISFCQQFYGLGFDSQAFMYWDFTRALKLNPFKDFFYPYGLLFYLKEGSFQWYIFSLFIILFMVMVIFLTFKLIFHEKKYLYLYFLSFCLFVGIYTNLDTFLRYAPLIIFSSLISYFANKSKLFTNLTGFISGFTMGIFFSFINDLFLYSGIIYACLFILYYFLNKKRHKYSLNQLISNFLLFLIGFCIGIIPLIYFLNINNLFNEYIFYYSTLKNIYLLAKVPFPPSLRSLENILIIFSLLFSMFALLDIIKNKTLNFKFYFLLSITLTILSLEQKNLIRSMYVQFSFFSIIILLILLDQFKSHLKNKIDHRVMLLFILNIILLIFLTIGFDRKFILEKTKFSFSEYNVSQCLENKVNKIDSKELNSYMKVKAYISKNKNAKIFSFPGDPIFYILFNQKPPFYPSIYEATPISAQKLLINYIENLNVNYIIYNRKSESIQDGVPDIVRGKLLYEYIKLNYKQVNKIDTFIILKRN